MQHYNFTIEYAGVGNAKYTIVLSFKTSNTNFPVEYTNTFVVWYSSFTIMFILLYKKHTEKDFGSEFFVNLIGKYRTIGEC